ncbi:MAG: hypothetical protein ACR2GH_07725 [Pseudonocardia sp.]
MQHTPFSAAVLSNAVIGAIVIGCASAPDRVPKNRGWEIGSAGSRSREESGAPVEG